jgi:hypothetical protein
MLSNDHDHLVVGKNKYCHCGFFYAVVLLCCFTSWSTSLFVVYADDREPFAIGFYFHDPSLPNTTCSLELDLILEMVYPTYVSELIADSNITQDTEDKFKKSVDDKNRKLQVHLRGGSNHRANTRHLQSWCYPLCDERPRAWLIAAGCRTECGLRRSRSLSQRNEDEMMYDQGFEKEESQNIDDNTERELEKDGGGNTTNENGYHSKILSGQGDLTASIFYRKVRENISGRNPCRYVLLNMYYRRYPLVIHVS